MMAAMDIRLRTMVTTTWPVSTAPRETSMTRNRLMIPFVMSSFTSVAVAFGLGFRSSASFGDWLGVAGIVVAACFATSWLTVAVGLAAKTPQSAAMATVPVVLLPFFSSAIVPAAKMGQGVRQFAEYQPFTPIIESLRGLLAGSPSAGYLIAALAWCAGIAVVGYVWALSTFNKASLTPGAG